ncbi:SurA N-terminal domain-containing protein [Candidatus Saccharibacteria bacterium]|nr:SurA N-terminal domain-containing protein [Candidatus Saccharibacteria bacterium]
MKKYISKIHKKVTKSEQTVDDHVAQAVRITNETVAEHREEVLSSARKYIYPLQQSKHKIVIVTTAIFITVIVAFFSYTTLALYKIKSNSSFLYGVTRVVPFPIARTGSNFVAYENYLFELRHYIHYYERQQKVDFRSESGQQQLDQFKKRALDKVVNDAYIKQLAREKGITVSDAEVDAEIHIVRIQNRLGENDKVFEDVLKEYWGWSVDDFKRSLRQQKLAQKLLPILDPEAVAKIEDAQKELKNGVEFSDVAKKYSDDVSSKDNGGEYGFAVDKSNRDIAVQTTEALFKLNPGEVSDIVNTGYTLEIVKNIETQGDKIRAAHISCSFKEIGIYLNDYKDKHKAKLYIRL